MQEGDEAIEDLDEDFEDEEPLEASVKVTEEDDVV